MQRYHATERAVLPAWPAMVRQCDIGDTRPEKAFSSQCVLYVPIGDTSRQKGLRYQQTARPVLNRGVSRHAQVPTA